MSITALKRKTQARTNHKITPTFDRKIKTRGMYTRSIFGYSYTYKKKNIDPISKKNFDKKIESLNRECSNGDIQAVTNQTLQKSYENYYHDLLNSSTACTNTTN